MAHWVIRAGAPSIDVNERSSIIVIKSRRRPSIRPQDDLFLLQRDASWGVFTHHAIVREVEAAVTAERESFRSYTIIVDHWVPLDTPIEIELFRYSLTAIRNQEKPYLHFNMGYRRLPAPDVSAILDAEPFLARTIYYELLDALPLELQREFLAELVGNPALAGGEATFHERARRTIKFIEDRVLTPGRLLQELQIAVAQLELYGPDKEAIDHEFVGEEATPHGSELLIDNMREQLDLFKALADLLVVPAVPQASGETGDLFSEVFAELNTNARHSFEERYEQAFRSVV